MRSTAVHRHAESDAPATLWTRWLAGIRVADLLLLGGLAFLWHGLVNLTQHLIEDGAVLVFSHPYLETFQRTVIWPLSKT